VPVSFKRRNAAAFAFIAGMALSILCMHSWYVQSVTFLSFPSDVHWGIPVVGSIMNQMSGYVIYLTLVAGNALIFTSFIKQMMRTGRKGTMLFAAICFTLPFFVVAWLIQAEPILPSVLLVHPGVPVIWLAVCHWLITWSGLELVMGALLLTVVRVRDAITERRFKLLSMIVAINLLLIILGYLLSTTVPGFMLLTGMVSDGGVRSNINSFLQPTFPFYNPVITFQTPQVAWLQVVNTLATLFPFVGLSTFLLAFVESEKSSRMWRAILIFACLFTLAMGAYLISFLWTGIDILLQLRVLSLQALQSSDFFSVTAAMGCVAGMTVAVVLLFKALKQGFRSPMISSAGTSSEADTAQPPMMQQ
jgi:hypothetical protein